MKVNNRILSISALILGLISLSFTPNKEASPYETQISQLMSKMTLEEKVGQMAQFSVDVVLKSKIPGVPDFPVTVDEAKATHILGDLKAGSLLNTPGGVAQTPAVWDKLVSQLQAIALKHSSIPMNTYSLMHSTGLYEHWRKDIADKRAFLLIRQAFAGQQRNSATLWSSDITCTCTASCHTC